MQPDRRISDDDVSFAIRYLDPDLCDEPAKPRRHAGRRKKRHWVRLALLIVWISIALYFSVLRWLPALVRFIGE